MTEELYEYSYAESDDLMQLLNLVEGTLLALFLKFCIRKG